MIITIIYYSLFLRYNSILRGSVRADCERSPPIASDRLLLRGSPLPRRSPLLRRHLCARGTPAFGVPIRTGEIPARGVGPEISPELHAAVARLVRGGRPPPARRSSRRARSSGSTTGRPRMTDEPTLDEVADECADAGDGDLSVSSTGSRPRRRTSNSGELSSTERQLFSNSASADTSSTAR